MQNKKTLEEKIPAWPLKRASPRFWVQNMLKKREEFGEYHRRVQDFEMRVGNIFSSKIINK